MTTAETDETVECGRQEVGSIIIRDGGEKEGNKKPSFTTLSTIAIQAGRSQIVISILKSGSLVHLQLVQVHPGLCEIGLSKAENQTLIQEQQQLIEKLKKHEREVLAVVERSSQTEMKKRDEGMMEQKKSIKNKKEEVVNKAMAASLSEGWSLLLHLLERRQEVLTLALDFYNRTQEFNTSIDRMEDLRIKPDHKQLSEIQVIYGSMRKELLEKSLQVLSSSSVLLHKLRQLQKTEALQRRGAVMQDKEQEDEGSQCSTGVILKLEELVEKLQDRRRKLDQAAVLQIQLVESSIKYCKEEGGLRQSSYMNWSPDKFPYQTWQSGSTPAEMSDLAPHSRTKDLQPGSRSGEAAVLDSGYKSKELQHEPALNTQSDSTLKQVSDQQPDSILKETKNQKPRSKSDRTRNLLLESRSEVNNDMQCKYASAESKGLLSGFRLKLQSVPRTQDTRTFESVTRAFLKPGSRKNVQSTSGSYLNPGSSSEGGKQQVRSKSEETGHFQSSSPSVLKKAFKSYVKPGSRSEAADVSFSELSRKGETKQHREVTSRQVAGQESMMGKETQSGVHTHQTFLTDQRQQLLLSCQQLKDKVWSWVQQGNSVLSYSSEVGRQLPEAEDSLNTHLQLHTQAQSADHDAEKLRQILDQIRALQTDQVTRTSHYCPSEANRQLSPLKALTEQLKRVTTGKQTRSRSTWSGPEVVDAPCTISPELAGGVDVVLSELQSLNRKIDANLQLLQPYVSFLRKAQQVEQEMEELREIYRRKPEEEEESEVSCSDIGSPQKKKEKMLQTFLTAQYLGNDYVHTVTMVSGSGLKLLSLVSVVQQTMERLRRTQQEVNKMQSFQQIQIQYQQEDMKYCKKYQERLFKNQQDLKCVSELLDSCTLMDLGSDLQTSSLLERFSQARPHFIQLDAEVEYMEKSWKTVRAVQDRLKAKALMGRTMGDEDLSELLKLHKRVNDKIQQTELILELSSSFHLTSKQLEALIQSDPARHSTGLTGFCRSSEAELRQLREEEQQIQSLSKKASALKTEISTAVSHSGWTCFKVKQLETRLLTLDSLSSAWLNEAARHEEKLVSDHIHWILDSFKDLKKHFSNMKFNYLKGNDQTRNMKAVRNQLQQVDLYEDKLQVLRKHLQAVMSLLGLEVKDGGVAREVDAINELQRQMSEFERSVSQHQKSLEMTFRLQQAIEEYQLWSEEAIATITRVGKLAMECRSTDAITVLHQQFEKFVWPTVPQQQERLSQITELAIRLHGMEKGQRYIEKTVSKHLEMVTSIRELSDELMELKAELKPESLKQQQNDEKKELTEKEKIEQRIEKETRGAEERQKKLREDRKIKKREQIDNRSTQEAVDMLKKMGHTPELIPNHDGKEVPMKRQTANKGKHHLQKNPGEVDGLTNASESRPTETIQYVYAIPATLLSSVIGPSFSDIQREFQGKDKHETGMQEESVAGWTEVELQQQEEMTEDSLSNDEYERPSPDDISLPPLAETPESSIVQSDIEEGICFSSHSIHSSQYHAQLEHSETDIVKGVVQQQTRQTKNGPSPPTSFQSNTRFRSKSSSFVQSPLTVPAPSTLTSTLYRILRTGETTTACFPRVDGLFMGNTELSFNSQSHPVHKSNTSDVPEKSSCSQTECLLLEHNTQSNQPQEHTEKPCENTTNLEPILSEEPHLQKGKSLSHNTRSHKGITAFPQIRTAICPDISFIESLSYSESCLHQDNNCQTRKPWSVSKSQMDTQTNTTTQQTIYFQSDPSNCQCTLAKATNSSPQSITEFTSRLCQSKTLPQINIAPQGNGSDQTPILSDSGLHEARAPPQHSGLLKPYAAFLQTSKIVSKSRNLPQPCKDSSISHDQGVPFSLTGKGTTSSSLPSTLATSTIVTQQTVYCQSFPAERTFACPKASSTIRTKQESLSSSGSEYLADVHWPVLPEPSHISSIKTPSSTITSSDKLSTRQSDQTVHSLHESLTSMCTQQYVHGLGISTSSPPKPAPSPQLKTEAHAFVQQAKLHVTPLQQPSSPLHLLTPEQDPEICQPMAIVEEIKLTPQIQGPPVPAPPSFISMGQTESLPQGRASKPGPPFFTRPLSRATIMEGSPVMLEVEVTGQPEPTLTWFKDEKVVATTLGQALDCAERKDSLFSPEASHSDRGLYEAWAMNHQDSQWKAGNSSSDEKWLIAEVIDWHTWFGTLCFLLFLIYLIVL